MDSSERSDFSLPLSLRRTLRLSRFFLIREDSSTTSYKKKTTDNLILCSSVSENITIIVCLTVSTKTQTSTQA